MYFFFMLLEHIVQRMVTRLLQLSVFLPYLAHAVRVPNMMVVSDEDGRVLSIVSQVQRNVRYEGDLIAVLDGTNALWHHRWRA